MSLKKKLTAKVVDSATDYAKGTLEKIKELDLDNDGQRDVDEIKKLVDEVRDRARDAFAATDFSKLASGFEQVMNGASLLGSSVDGAKLSAAFKALIPAVKKTAQLVELGAQALKEKRAAAASH